MPEHSGYRFDQEGSPTNRHEFLGVVVLAGVLLASSIGGKFGYDYALRTQRDAQARRAAIRNRDLACLRVVRELSTNASMGQPEIPLVALTPQQQKECGVADLIPTVRHAIDEVPVPLDVGVTMDSDQLIVRLPSQRALKAEIDMHAPRNVSAATEKTAAWTAVGSLLGLLSLTAAAGLGLALRNLPHDVEPVSERNHAPGSS
jgi:hypothetical protein